MPRSDQLVMRIVSGRGETGRSPDRAPGELKAGAAGNGRNAGGETRGVGRGPGEHLDARVPAGIEYLNQ